MKSAFLLFGALMSVACASAVEITSPKDQSLPHTRLKISPKFELYFGAGSNVKEESLKVGDVANDIGCSVLLSRKFSDNAELGFDATLNPKGIKSIYAFWKWRSVDLQVFAPKSATNSMFLGYPGPFNSMDFAAIDPANAMYTTSKKFIVDGLCKDKSSGLISKKISLYLTTENEANNFKLGFSFTPSTHTKAPVIEKKDGLSVGKLLEARTSSFQGNNMISLAQSYEHKWKNGITLKICTIEEFGSLKSLDLSKVKVEGKDHKGDLKKAKYTPCNSNGGNEEFFSYKESQACAIGISGELGINNTTLKAAVSKVGDQDELNCFTIFYGLEHKFMENLTAGFCCFQSWDKQNAKLIGTTKSFYRAIDFYVEKEIVPEVDLYFQLTHYRGDKEISSPTNHGFGFAIGTVIKL